MNPPSEERSSRVLLAKSERKSPAHAKSHGPTAPDKEISVSIIVKRKNPLKLSELKGKHVTHAKFLEEYAADPTSFDSLKSFAKAQGLTVDDAGSSVARRTLKLRGTATNIGKAFGVTLNNYEYPEHAGKHFHAYEGKISVPAEHADLVEAVLGLDSRPIAKPHIRMRKHAQQQQQATSFSPVQVAQLYNFPTSVNGAGQTIGIIELGGGFTTSDLDTYFQDLGLKTPNVVAVSVDGGSNAPSGDPSSADGEVMLDIEVAGAVAPGANIAVYFTDNSEQGFQDALTSAVHDTTNKPSVLSISWGAPEADWSQQFMTSFDDACQSAGALGVSITVASGDNGSSDGGSGDNVDFPASSPHVLGCGGTALYANGGQIAEEVVWNDQSQGGGATGGGVSTVFPLPSWQSGANVPSGGSSGGRGVPDVSGDASPETGYNIQVDGQQTVVGGTSAVAPLWAGLIALINQQNGAPLGFFNPTLYQNGENGFNDITQGNNGDFSAGTGWDACTGLGSPNGTQLASLLSSASSTPTS